MITLTSHPRWQNSYSVYSPFPFSHSDYCDQIHFNIAKNHFTYLGIKINKNFKDLYRYNFSPLVVYTQQALSKWSPMSMSLIGRKNAIKIVILPKFLYIFQAVPSFVLKTFFDKIDSLTLSYVWNNKSSRVNKLLLQKSKKGWRTGFTKL